MAHLKAIALFDSEWDALAGLPAFQFKLYLVLRWYMDKATGRVGIKRGISLKSLAEEMYVEPVRGRHSADAGEPTRKAIRSALDALVNAKLLQPCGNGEVLVFLMPLARRALARPKDEGHMRGTDDGHDEGHAKSRASTVFRGNEGHDEGHTQNADEGHTSRVKVNPLSVEAIAAALPVVDKKLSTVAQLPLLPVLSDSGVAEWVRLKEFARGCRARVLASDVRNTGWIVSGVSADQIAEAYSLAAGDREVTNNPAPLNVAFLDIFVQRVLKGSVVCRSGGERRVGGASGALAEKEAAAVRLGVAPRADGESVASFVSRIGLEEEARALGVAGQQEGESVVGLMARIDAAKAERRRISG